MFLLTTFKIAAIILSLQLEHYIMCPTTFHALTGCDTVSSFAGHGKKTAWSTCKSLPELTYALLMLSDGPKQISMIQLT